MSDLDVRIERLDPMRVASFRVVSEEPELAESVVKLEQDYDNDIFNNEMSDLKHWLHRKGIRLD